VANFGGISVIPAFTALMNVPTADVVTNVLMRDAVGNKTDATVTTVAATKSLVGYAKGALDCLVAPPANSALTSLMKYIVGNKADAAIYTVGVTDSLMALVKGILNNQTTLSGVNCYPGDTLRASGDGVVTQAAGAFTKHKEIKTDVGGTIRVKFDMLTNGMGYISHGRIYKNGVAFGTDQTTNSLTYVTFSQDLFFAQTDLIQLYIYNDNVSGICSACNLRLYAVAGISFPTCVDS